MKTTEPKKHETGGAEEQDVAIDTSKMNAGQRAALELTEAARDATTLAGSFGQSLFMGRCELERMLPFPQATHEDVDQGDAFLHRLEKFLIAAARFPTRSSGDSATWARWPSRSIPNTEASV